MSSHLGDALHLGGNIGRKTVRLKLYNNVGELYCFIDNRNEIF